MPRVLQARKPSVSLAKLNPPRLPAIVERPRLYRLLDRDRKRPIIWINAPPGFGKTTLVSSYLRARKIRPLWYQVDEGDGDLATFFHYLSLAAKQVAPRYRTPLPHLTPEYLQGLPTFTRRFFEQLYERLKPPTLLILDNYQEVPLDSLFHQTVALGIEVLPERMNVIVMSRALPPPAFARLQAAQHIGFLDEEDLRLTNTEARAVVRLHEQSKRQSRPAQIETLHDKLQGWVAGLVLQLEQAKMDKQWDAILPGETPQIIFDYLAREVLQRLSPETHGFLLRTAFLPDMTVAMAEKLTGNASAGDILAGLFQTRYFTERRPGAEHLYQYHPLFREFLQAQARAVLHPDQVAEVQRCAASLLEEAGRVEDAVALYAEAGQLQEIVRLVMARGPELLQQGRGQRLEEWLKRIPSEQYEQEPWLHYWRGTCRMPVAPMECEAHFEHALNGFKAKGDHVGMLMATASMMATVQFSWIDISRFDRWIDIMGSLVPPEYVFPSEEIKAQVTFCTLTALMWRRPQLVGPWMERAKKLLETRPGIEKYSPLSASLAHLFSWLGDMASAEKYLTILKTSAESETAAPLLRLSHYATWPQLEWTRGDAQSALAMVEQGLAISESTGVHVFDAAFWASGVYSSFLLGDLVRAEQYLNNSAPFVTHPAHIMRANYLFQQAWLIRIKGDVVKAWDLIQRGLYVEGLKGSPFPEGQLTCAAAELLHALGNDREATQYLSLVKSIADEMGSFVLRYMERILESKFQFDQGRDEAAQRALKEAFAIGRGKGLYFSPWWIPTTMARLCTKALEADIEVEYVQNLIRKTHLVPDDHASASEAWPWPVKIYTLGRFEIFVDGKPLPSRRKASYRVLTLLKAMIAMGGQDIPTSRLIDALWPDAEGDTGEETFHKTLQRLRRLLNHDSLIQVREGKVSLNRQVCWVDAMVFQSLLSGMNDSKPRQAQSDARSRYYEQAIALYRGPFLEAEGSYEWADRYRERFRQQFVQTVQHLSEWKEAEGQEEATLACLKNGLEADALAESLYPRLIRFLVNLERQDEAKNVLARYQKAVVMAGREPSAEMQHLAKNLSLS